MFAYRNALALGPVLLAQTVLGYPKGVVLNPTLTTRDNEFIFSAIGDSWGSGVQWSDDTAYDGNEDGCMRYKYAWSTVVNDKYQDWTPNPDQGPLFEFRACSGARLGQNIHDQMDKLTRPKMTLLEAGGNNAQFYDMADFCLFHSDRNKDYGTKYEDDNAEDPTGKCRSEIKEVRNRVGGGLKQAVLDTIETWRYHPAVGGNDATLFMLGYARFFALDDACNDWNFGVQYQNSSQTQTIKKEMRQEFNDLVDAVNLAIRSSVEQYNDPKIQYIDINPALEGHRFCEPGHSWWSQLNYGSNVHIWNNPARLVVTIHDGDAATTYESSDDPGVPGPPEDVVEKLRGYPEGEAVQQDQYTVLTFRDPANPGLWMEWKVEPQPLDGGSGSKDGRIARTLHPTQDGHKDMGDLIVEALKKNYRPDGTSPEPSPAAPAEPSSTTSTPCPAGCTCNGPVPLCT
ncbi:hypothetical protein J4E91_002895 [Alternaria rosae]|nr:hypothetical protein J4E91_002895 [Alternaria rosae]